MDGKEAIIKRILDDSAEKCAEIERKAGLQAEEIVKNAEEWAKAYETAQEEILRKDVRDIVERRLTVAELDVRKDLLLSKQEIIGRVFDLSYKKLCGLKKKDYLDFIENLLVKYSDPGDGVVLSADKVLNADDIKQLKIFTDNKLKIESSRGDFTGGVKLVGKTCDKDLSFKTLVETEKEKLSAKIAEYFFGS